MQLLIVLSKKYICFLVAPIDHVYGSLALVQATSTQNYADISKLRPEIEGPGSFTFFAPSNDAWGLLDEVSQDKTKGSLTCCSLCHILTTFVFLILQTVRNALVSNVNIELFNALHYHMVNKRLLTKDLKNGLKLTSMYNDLGLYINHYSNGVSTAL